MQGTRQFVGLIVSSAAQMGGMLRHCHYDIRTGQAGYGFKQKISQQGGKVEMPVKLEPKQGVPQGSLIEAVESSSAPRRGILKACAADAVASLWIRRRNSAARASGPGVWDKLSPALGAKEGFRRCRGMACAANAGEKGRRQCKQRSWFSPKAFCMRPVQNPASRNVQLGASGDCHATWVRNGVQNAAVYDLAASSGRGWVSS